MVRQDSRRPLHYRIERYLDQGGGLRPWWARPAEAGRPWIAKLITVSELAIGTLLILGLVTGAAAVAGLSLPVIALAARVKRAGAEFAGDQRELLLLNAHPDEEQPYERLLGDALAGDGALFTCEDAVEAAWAVGEPVLENHNRACPYPPGSWVRRRRMRSSRRTGAGTTRCPWLPAADGDYSGAEAGWRARHLTLSAR